MSEDKMTRVCLDTLPKGSSRDQRKDGFYIDPWLKAQLDLLLKNIARDWDFTIIITGGGEVRVGKSVLAMQIGYYWNYMIKQLYNKDNPFNPEDNFIFDGKKLIEKGNKLGKNNSYSVLIYDEAGADLEGTKVMQQSTQDVLDYFRECGQYNMLNILVLPDFFALPKAIAMTRSIFLLDVSYHADAEGNFLRGYFSFYSKKNKKYLYLNGKRDLNYKAYRYNFHGRFTNLYTIPEGLYREMKQQALVRRESKRRNKFQMQRDASWFLLNKECKVTQQEISRRMEQLTGFFITREAISDGLRHFSLENE